MKLLNGLQYSNYKHIFGDPPQKKNESKRRDGDKLLKEMGKGRAELVAHACNLS